MRLWKAFVVGLIALATAMGVGVLGSSEGRATARTVDPFTLSSAPAFGIYGKHISFTIDFVNASAQTLAHAHFRGFASSNGPPPNTLSYNASLSSTSRGTCAPDPANALAVNCDYGNLESGAHVTSTFVYNLPTAASGATSVGFDATNGLRTNESGGGGCTPGQGCVFSPTPSSVSVPVKAATDDENSDIFGTQGGLLETTVPFSTKTVTNPTGTHITVPAGPVTPASIVEGGTDPNVCGTEATPVGVVTNLTVPRTFPGNTLGVAWDLLASQLPKGGSFNDLVLCHNGAVVPSTRSKFKNGLNQLVYRLTGAFDSNGQVGGGI